LRKLDIEINDYNSPSQKKFKKRKKMRCSRSSILSSIYSFCRSNLSDANDKYGGDFEVLDLLEIIDEVGIEKGEK
jgi:Fe-S oxidoreductase